MFWRELERFSALQRAEIAEIGRMSDEAERFVRVSVLFNEPKLLKCLRHNDRVPALASFSALQRAEIAEIAADNPNLCFNATVSVLFNEPKLLKSSKDDALRLLAERFQCSSTSRNC